MRVNMLNEGETVTITVACNTFSDVPPKNQHLWKGDLRGKELCPC